MSLNPMYRGDSRFLTGTVVDEDTGVAADITGAVITFSVRSHYLATDVLFQKVSSESGEVTLTSVETGEYEVAILPEDTQDAEPGTYFYDVEILTLEGDTFTLERGEFEILFDITRPSV